MGRKTIEVKVGEYGKETTDKAEFAALIERYKVQNPIKYEQRKEALEARLASME